MIKTCNSLFRMSKIISVDCVQHLYQSTDITLCGKNRKCSVNLESLPMFKIWMHNQLCIWTTISNLASLLTKHIYQCSLQMLRLSHQVLTFAELLLLIGGGKLRTVYFCENVIKNGDGSITEFEKVFEVLLCNNMQFNFPKKQHGIANGTTKRIGEILKKETKSRCIIFCYIPENFDFLTFSGFLKENMVNRKHKIDLNYYNPISDAYKNQLKQFVNEIIQTPNLGGRAVPFIYFQNRETYMQLNEMRHQ